MTNDNLKRKGNVMAIDFSYDRLDHPFYHLDCPVQLPHLDSLLNIGELSGVQWVPGDGQPEPTEWPEVYQRMCS
jgi:hypothetical protein